MERRTFVVVLAGGMLATPLAARAQQGGRIPRVGFLAAVSRSAPGVRAFEERLRQLGYADGRNIVIEFRTGAGNLDLLPGLAAELVRSNVDVLVAGGAGQLSVQPFAPLTART